MPLALALSSLGGCLDGGTDDLGVTEQDITPAPMNLVATITGPSSVNLTWSAVTGATAYEIQRSNTPGTETNYTTNSPATSTTFNDSHLLANTQYCYVVRAYVPGAGGISNASNEQCVTMSSGPQAPTNVTATATSSSSITVQWAAVATATTYYVLMSTGGGAYSQIGTATPPTTSLVVNGLAPSTTYSFEVRAGFTGGAVSAPSTPPASATTFPAGLEGYYRYDDRTGTTAVDASGYSRTATLSGGAAFATTPQAPVRDANNHNYSNLSLPTSTSVATTTAITTNFNQDATIAAWVHVPALPTGSSVISIAGRRDTGCGANQSWLLGDSASGLFFAGAVGVTRSFGVQLTAATWTHVAVTQHAGTIRMYVNGVQVAALAYTAGPTSNGGFDVGAVAGCANGGAVNVDELKIFSRTLSATEVATLGTPPGAPTNLVTTLIDSCKIALSYTAPSTGADLYYIYKGTMAGNETYLTSNTPTTFNWGHMTPNQTTSWKVQAQKNQIVGPFSNELVVTTLGPPPAPTNVAAAISTCCTPKRVNLTWTAEPRAVVYLVYQSTSGGPFTKLAGVTGTSYQVSNLTSGTTYSWYIVSQDDCQTQGPPSATVSQTMP